MPDFSKLGWVSNFCGGGDNDMHIRIFGEIQHTDGSLIVEVISRRSSSGSSGSLVSREVRFSFANETIGMNRNGLRCLLLEIIILPL